MPPMRGVKRTEHADDDGLHWFEDLMQYASERWLHMKAQKIGLLRSLV